MPQISLYIDEVTLRKVELQAKSENLSISKWVAEQIKNKVDPKYPVDFESLYGSISEELSRPSELPHTNDTIREIL